MKPLKVLTLGLTFSLLFIISGLCGCLNNNSPKTYVYPGDSVVGGRIISNCEVLIRNKSYYGDSCVRQIVADTGNTSLCGKLQFIEGQLFCYAIGAHNVSLCDSIGDEHDNNRNSCIVDVAILSNDSTICENLSGIFLKDICYAGVATRVKNSSICDKITYKDQQFDIRTECYNALQHIDNQSHVKWII
jgi:hypothetical protein